MSNIHPQSKWAAAKKLALALPLLALSAIAVPNAHADDHYGRLHHKIHRDERRGDYARARADRRELHYREGYYRHGYGYYHDGRFYQHRRYYYRGGERYYGYYGPAPGGVSVNIGL